MNSALQLKSVVTATGANVEIWLTAGIVVDAADLVLTYDNARANFTGAVANPALSEWSWFSNLYSPGTLLIAGITLTQLNSPSDVLLETISFTYVPGSSGFSVALVGGASGTLLTNSEGVDPLMGTLPAINIGSGSLLTTISNIDISADTGISSSDFITSTAPQIITGTLSAGLGAGEQLYGSVDNGTTWREITAKVNGTAISWDGAILSGSSTIQFEVRDAASHAGTPALQSYVVDIMAPTVLAISPADHLAGVGVGDNMVVTFSEAILRGTGVIEIHSGSAAGSLVASYNVATSPNLAISGTTLTINPTENLLNDTHNYVTLAAGSVKDLAGNNYSGTTTPYDFTTDPPLTPLIRNGVSVVPARYIGPATAAGGQPIHFEYLGDSSNEVVLGTHYNDFINVGGGVDAVDAGEGNDVIDGGTASNFLTGGGGTDIFFCDGRGGATTWSTITDWQAGEQLSVWGWQPGVSKIVAWVQAGATGYEGLTMHADLNGDGTIDTSVTFSGIVSQSQLPAPLEFAGVLWFV
jgi:Ca2+-binding RTX toxin-like protein